MSDIAYHVLMMTVIIVNVVMKNEVILPAM